MMNEHWLKSQEHSDVCGHDHDESVDSPDYPDTTDTTPDTSPELLQIRNDYRWTPACQRAFLMELACSGSVMLSARHVGKSRRSGYDLRHARAGAAFALGWDAAILVARAAFADMLMDRAIHGYEETTVKQGDGSTLRSKYDNRLSKAMLDRLDRMAEAEAVRGSRAAQVQLVVQDFESFLDLIERGGKGSEAALFFAARDEQDGTDDPDAIACELAQNSGDDDDLPKTNENIVADVVAQLLVWYDETEECWKTDFPPRNADDAEKVEECGRFGDLTYERTLTDEEQAAQQAWLDDDLGQLRTAALAAREAWFDWKEAA
jgi:hypothetical protein